MSIHHIYGDFDLARATGEPGISLASFHESGERYPCSAELIEIFEPELGMRVTLAIEDEYLGFGPLFDLSYEQYIRSNGYSEEEIA